MDSKTLESNILLKNFIMDSPAPSRQHTQAIGWLNDIHRGYSDEQKKLQKQVDALEAELNQLTHEQKRHHRPENPGNTEEHRVPEGKD